MFDYECEYCGFSFFTEEGYNASLDAIVCPVCGAAYGKELEVEV